MDGVIYAEETVGGPGSPENETELPSASTLWVWTSAFCSFSGYRPQEDFQD